MAEESIDFARLLSAAKNHLIHHEYQHAISTCLYGLDLIQNTDDLGAVKIDEDSKKHRLQVAFGILAIQALALDKQGHEVSSFVEQWFGEVRAWPAEILQIRYGGL